MIEEKKVLINGLEVNYKIAGEENRGAQPSAGRMRREGCSLLILHGWGGSSGSWIRVQEILAKKGYKVICPDFPGFGKSKTPIQPWGVTDYANWVVKFANSQNLENFFIAAHSFGGRVAIRFAIKYPERIKSLILCASAGIKPKPGLKTKIIYRISRVGNAIFTPKPLARFKDGARNFFYIFLRHKDYVKADGTMKETIKKVLEEDLFNDLSKIKTKTLLVWGEKDRLVPLKYAYIFKENLENSELKILPKIGHSPHLEVPQKIAEIISRFIS